MFQLRLPIRLTARTVVIGEPKLFREILTDSSTDKPLEVYKHFANTNGGTDSIFTLNGKDWHAKRKAVAPAFSSNNIKRMTEVALKKTEAWIQDTLSSSQASFDVGKEMIAITLSAIAETAFEYSMSREEQKYFLEQLELVLIEFTFKSSSNPFRCLFGWFIPERRRAFVAARNLERLCFKIMDEYRQKGPSKENTIIKLIMESDAHESDKEKAAEMLTYLVGGHDTTAFSIAWVLLELARNPDEQRKLRESLSQLSPHEWSRSEVLQRVVKEGMRLHTVAAGGSIRVTAKGMMTSRNEILPKGSIAFLPFILMFRNPDIFENPDAFQPSRWESPTREMLDAFNPFSLGKQNCVGQSLAKAEIFAIIPRICSEFELSVEDEGSVEYFLTLKPAGARLSARKL